MIEAANSIFGINSYKRGPEDVKLYGQIYDIKTGNFKGIVKTLDFIVIYGDGNEIFFSYGFDQDNSNLLYWIKKTVIFPANNYW